jgi:hypothetical protein
VCFTILKFLKIRENYSLAITKNDFDACSEKTGIDHAKPALFAVPRTCGNMEYLDAARLRKRPNKKPVGLLLDHNRLFWEAQLK